METMNLENEKAFRDWLWSHPYPCTFEEGRTCTREFECTGCEYQPDDDCKACGLNEPVVLEWESSVYGDAEYPVCPSCGEMPYSTKRCFFCGQKFVLDEKLNEFEKELEENRKESEVW